MTDIVTLYNPANAAALTPEQIEGLQKLTSDQIKELAKAYPNLTMQRAYLLIIDSSLPVNKQLPNLSSFENLWNLREKNSLRKYVAFNFKGAYQPRTVSTVKPRRSEVLDLSDHELMTLPGFKAAANGTISGDSVQAVVTKVNKVPKSETVSNPTIKPMQSNTL